jgi:hypothetical protein
MPSEAKEYGLVEAMVIYFFRWYSDNKIGNEENDSFTISTTYLADRFCCSKRKVQTSVNHLIELGIIERFLKQGNVTYYRYLGISSRVRTTCAGANDVRGGVRTTCAGGANSVRTQSSNNNYIYTKKEKGQSNNPPISPQGDCAERQSRSPLPVEIENEEATELTAQSPVVIKLPLNDKTEYGVTEADLAHYEELYQAVNVMSELRGMLGWLEANPAKRKTNIGIKAFIARWLKKAQDRGGSYASPRSSPAKEPTGVSATMELLREERARMAREQEETNGQVRDTRNDRLSAISVP